MTGEASSHLDQEVEDHVCNILEAATEMGRAGVLTCYGTAWTTTTSGLLYESEYSLVNAKFLQFLLPQLKLSHIHQLPSP